MENTRPVCPTCKKECSIDNREINQLAGIKPPTVVMGYTCIDGHSFVFNWEIASMPDEEKEVWETRRKQKSDNFRKEKFKNI